ncbi:ThiF family adenylyltransferase [Schumannella soli]|nr:ThiF family adenylyltransferase [Schumannella soli]
MESERSVRERLASASVTVVGAGAIGSRVATTLAASGVGTIEIVDDARDGETWRAETVAGAVAATVATTHPQTIVRARPTRLAAGSTFDLLLDADLVVDASDDPATRYASNDGAAVVSIPLVWATADADGGEIGSGWDELELDYRDAHPERHPVADGAEHDATDRATDDTAASAPARQGEPSLALVTATAALASELALTLLRDRRTAGLLVRLDRTGTVGERMPLTRSPGVRPGSLEETTAPVEHPDDLGVSAIELAQLLAPESLGLLEERPVLLDVREPAEAEIARIPGSLLIPFDQLTLRMGELDATKPLVVYCHHGIRSDEALTILRRQGFAARHLTGGIESWSLTVDPAVPRY